MTELALSISVEDTQTPRKSCVDNYIARKSMQPIRTEDGWWCSERWWLNICGIAWSVVWFLFWQRCALFWVQKYIFGGCHPTCFYDMWNSNQGPRIGCQYLKMGAISHLAKVPVPCPALFSAAQTSTLKARWTTPVCVLGLFVPVDQERVKSRLERRTYLAVGGSGCRKGLWDPL